MSHTQLVGILLSLLLVGKFLKNLMAGLQGFSVLL
jgi:hypothetical protein